MPNRTKFTVRAREKFIQVLRAQANVSNACTAINVSRRGAYSRREADPAFAAAWDEAIEEAADALEAEAWRRAVSGVERPIVWKGEVTGTVREYSDRLLECLLRAHRPEKFRIRYQVQVATDNESFGEALKRARERVRAAREEAGEATRPHDSVHGTDACASGLQMRFVSLRAGKR